jgi:CRISPR-associated protein Csb1
LSYPDAVALYNDAFKAAKDAGFALPAEPIHLAPQDKLVAIVLQSQRLALAGQGGEEESGKEP